MTGCRGSLGSVKKDTCKSHPKREKLRGNTVLERGKDVPKITQQGSRGTENRSSSQPWAQHPPDLQVSPLISRAFRKETKCVLVSEIKHMRRVSRLLIILLCNKGLLQSWGSLFSSIQTMHPLLFPLTPELHDPTMKNGSDSFTLKMWIF